MRLWPEPDSASPGRAGRALRDRETTHHAPPALPSGLNPTGSQRAGAGDCPRRRQDPGQSKGWGWRWLRKGSGRHRAEGASAIPMGKAVFSPRGPQHRKRWPTEEGGCQGWGGPGLGVSHPFSLLSCQLSIDMFMLDFVFVFFKPRRSF